MADHRLPAPLSSDGQPAPATFVIAEAGVNHNGSLELAFAMIDAAAAAGADAVKFQSFKTERYVSRTAQKAEYQIRTTGADERQFAMIKRLELAEESQRTLAARCRERGIRCLFSPFDEESVDFVAHELGMPVLKLPSGEVTNGPLLLRAGRTGRSLILSTGMSLLGEVEEALGVLAWAMTTPCRDGERPTRDDFIGAYRSGAGRRALAERVTLLHCTTEYPTPFTDVNLRAMDTLRDAFGLPVGYSDHTPGIAIPVAAVARGASVIEKHFTLDRTMEGPDHAASLEPGELRAMVEAIRAVEQGLGSPLKAPAAAEVKNIPIARKALVAAVPIRRGEVFQPHMIAMKRPAAGLSPMAYWSLVGLHADRDYHEDEPLAFPGSQPG